MSQKLPGVSQLKDRIAAKIIIPLRNFNGTFVPNEQQDYGSKVLHLCSMTNTKDRKHIKSNLIEILCFLNTNSYHAGIKNS